MPTMKALKPHKFSGRMVRPGETYEATDDEAKTVRVLGWATDTEGQEPPRARRQYRRRDMTAEQ